MERAKEETRGKKECTEEEGAPLSRAQVRTQNNGGGAAIQEWEAPDLTAGVGDRDFIPGLEVQNPFFDKYAGQSDDAAL